MPVQLQPVADPRQANLSTADLQAAPATAALADSGFVAVYENKTDNVLNVRLFDALGKPSDFEKSIGGAAGEVRSQPDVAALDGGGFVVVYTRTSGGNQDVVFQRFDAQGQEVGGETVVEGAGDAADENEASVAVLGNGDFAISWTDKSAGADGDIRAAVYSEAGALVKAPVAASFVTGVQSGSDIAALADGGFAVGYTTTSAGDTDVYFSRFDGAYQEQLGGKINTIDAGEIQSGVSLTGLAGGGFAAAFKHTPLIGNDAIRARLFDDLGIGVADDFAVSSISANEGDPAIAATADGFAVAYSFLNAAGEFDVRISQYAANGAPAGTAVTAGGGIAEPVGNERAASLVFTRDGRLVVTYTAADGAQQEIETQTFDGRDGQQIYGGPDAEAIVGREGTLPWIDDYINGNGGDDILYGIGGDDELVGNGGDDTLIGGAGTDTLSGGMGDDIYVDPTGDIIVEAAGAAGDLHDVVHSAASYNLAGAANVEDITLTGGANVNAIGSTGNNRLTGNSGNNILNGGGGTDFLIGLAGADTLNGGQGNDIYVNPEGLDIVGEAAGGGLHDRIQTLYSFNLNTVANVEDITLVGGLDSNAIGNNADNILIGNNGNNIVNGGGGADTITGGAGNDTMNGGNGADLFKFALANTGADRIEGFFIAQDRFDLSDGLFTALNISGSDTVLTHDGGTVRMMGIANLNLAQWNALVEDAGVRQVPSPRLAMHNDPIHTPTHFGTFGSPDFLYA